MITLRLAADGMIPGRASRMTEVAWELFLSLCILIGVDAREPFQSSPVHYQVTKVGRRMASLALAVWVSTCRGFAKRWSILILSQIM